MDLQQIITEVVPGSIWLRTDGSKARVLAVTNLSLPVERQQKYIPVVVYVGPSGKVFSRPLADFAGYFPTWIGFDQSAEKAMESLTVPLNGDAPVKPVRVAPAEDDEAIDMSLDEPASQAAPVEKISKPAVQVRAKSNVPPSLLRAAFKIGGSEQSKTPAATADQLSQALRVYSQVPDEHLRLVVHKLSFELSPSLTIDMLKEVFQPDEWVNTVDMFRIGTPVSDETVGVDAYMGVYPEFTRSVLYGTVYIGADMPAVTPLMEHTHEVAQDQTTRPDENPAVEQPQEAEVSEVPVQDSPEVPPAIEQFTPDQPPPADVVPSTGEEAVPVVEVAPAEDSAKESNTPVAPAKKPRKKRTPKKVVEAPVATDDDDIDVANLS